MKFGYTIVYVPDVKVALKFFFDAFGFPERFLHESEQYGELETGETVLAFASHEIGSLNMPGGFVKASESGIPLGMEIAFVSENVDDAHKRAIKAGATEIHKPETKPWGQTVSYVRCPDGTLVELCTPIG